MKKILSISLVFLLSIAFFSFPNNANAKGKTTITLSCENENIYPDTEFTISYNITDADDVYAIGFDALYEEGKFELIDVEDGDFLEKDDTSALTVYNNREDDGVIIFAVTRTVNEDGADGDGTIVNFVFKALEIGSFEFTIENIILKDPSGKDMKALSESIEITVTEKDTEPPILEVEEIGTVTTETVVIKGETEPKASVMINDEEVEVTEDGMFEHEVTLEVGENEFVIIAKDPAGNETKVEMVITYFEPIEIKLQIGNKTVYVNGEPIQIEAAPFVDKNSGRTMVPIRVVAEAIGAEIGWEGTERKITLTQGDTIIELWLDKPIAKVNGVPTPIDVNAPKLAPKVVNGRTVLPLRFVAENLGCGIGWDGATQTITLIYPDPEN